MNPKFIGRWVKNQPFIVVYMKNDFSLIFMTCNNIFYRYFIYIHSILLQIHGASHVWAGCIAFDRLQALRPCRPLMPFRVYVITALLESRMNYFVICHYRHGDHCTLNQHTKAINHHNNSKIAMEHRIRCSRHPCRYSRQDDVRMAWYYAILHVGN